MTSLPHGLSRNEILHHQQSRDCKGNEAPGGNCHFENKADFFPSDQSKVTANNTQNGMTGQCPSLSDSAIPSNTQEKENSATLSYTCPICRTACLQTAGHNMRQLTEGDSGDSCPCRPVKDFLEDQPPEYFHSFMLTKKDLKRFIVMDIVFPCLQKTTCFTKR